MLEKWQQALETYLNYISEYPVLKAAVILFIFWLAAFILDKVIIVVIKRITRKTSTNFDDKLIDLLHQPIFTSLILLGIASATRSLEYSIGSVTLLYSCLATVAIFVWTRFIIKFSRYILIAIAGKPDKIKVLHNQTLPLFENLAFMLIFVIAIYGLFSTWGIDMTAWLASAGIVGIAIGFAAKDTLANLFSGVFILADAPYKIGDFVVLDTGERGEITKIGIRSTRMLTRDDVEVTVPNSVMGNTKIINESGGPHEKYRIRVNVGVAYGSDIDQVRDILMQVALNEPGVCSDPEPRVRFRMFGASSLDFQLLCWIDQPVLRGRILDHLNSMVYKQFIEETIEIPYSKQDIYIKEMPQK